MQLVGRKQRDPPQKIIFQISAFWASGELPKINSFLAMPLVVCDSVKKYTCSYEHAVSGACT